MYFRMARQYMRDSNHVGERNLAKACHDHSRGEKRLAWGCALLKLSDLQAHAEPVAYAAQGADGSV